MEHRRAQVDTTVVVKLLEEQQGRGASEQMAHRGLREGSLWASGADMVSDLSHMCPSCFQMPEDDFALYYVRDAGHEVPAAKNTGTRIHCALCCSRCLPSVMSGVVTMQYGSSDWPSWRKCRRLEPA